MYTKITKGVTAVRKLLLWKTNKDSVEPAFPVFVVHWTDYSPSRKDPLKREVRTASSEEVAMQIGDDMIAANIKKGWEPIESEAQPDAASTDPDDDSTTHQQPATSKKVGDKKAAPKKKAATKTVSGKKKVTTKKKTATKKKKDEDGASD